MEDYCFINTIEKFGTEVSAEGVCHLFPQIMILIKIAIGIE